MLFLCECLFFERFFGLKYSIRGKLIYSPITNEYVPFERGFFN